MTPTGAELATLTAGELLGCFADRSLSPVEVAESSLTGIEERDPTVNGFCFVDHDATLAMARASEQRWARGERAGLLDGVPVAVKDMFLTAGWPTRRGSALVDVDQPWPDDAPAVAALRRHGAVLVGKTTTPELGWKGRHRLAGDRRHVQPVGARAHFRRVEWRPPASEEVSSVR